MSCEFSLFSEATPFAAPVAATVLAVPFGHAFPLFTLRKYRRAFCDRLLLGGCGDPMNDRHNFLRGAVGTNGYFFCCARYACAQTSWQSLRASYGFLARLRPASGPWLPRARGRSSSSRSPGRVANFWARYILTLRALGPRHSPPVE